MLLSDFDYPLPEELIAQEPLAERDRSRLLVLDRANATIEHRSFYQILDYLRDDDLIVFNNTRVIAARLNGHKETGGKVEALLVGHISPGVWEAIVKPGRRVGVGTGLVFDDGLTAKVVERTDIGGQIRAIRCRARPRRSHRIRGTGSAATVNSQAAGRPRALSDGLRCNEGFRRRTDSGTALYTGFAGTDQGAWYPNSIHNTSRGHCHLSACSDGRCGQS